MKNVDNLMSVKEQRWWNAKGYHLYSDIQGNFWLASHRWSLIRTPAFDFIISKVDNVVPNITNQTINNLKERIYLSKRFMGLDEYSIKLLEMESKFIKRDAKFLLERIKNES